MNVKAAAAASECRPFQGYEYKNAPSENHDGARIWWARGQNYVTAYVEAKSGAVLERSSQPDEYMLYLPDIGASIRAGAADADAPAHSLAIVPPGPSRVTIRGDGIAVFIFSSLAQDLTAKCFNAASYSTPDPLVTPLQPWPTPPDGFKLRIYALDDYPPMGYPSAKPWSPTSGETRFGRYFRSTNLMVHLHQRVAARDQGKTFPHAQSDYEQAAVSLEGERVHHVRTPWGPDMSLWREDGHVSLGSPSFLVFPPGLIHTTTTVSSSSKWVDVFSPPRADISLRAGWVRNADEYPMPEQ